MVLAPATPAVGGDEDDLTRARAAVGTAGEFAGKDEGALALVRLHLFDDELDGFFVILVDVHLEVIVGVVQRRVCDGLFESHRSRGASRRLLARRRRGSSRASGRRRVERRVEHLSKHSLLERERRKLIHSVRREVTHDGLHIRLPSRHFRPGRI